VGRTVAGAPSFQRMEMQGRVAEDPTCIAAMARWSLAQRKTNWSLPHAGQNQSGAIRCRISALLDVSRLVTRRGPALILFSFDFAPNNDGGIVRLCTEIFSGLARAGIRCDVLSQSPRNGVHLPATTARGARMTGRRPWREICSWHKLLQLRRQGPVVCGIWYPEGLLAFLAGVRPLVILVHGSELMPARALWRRRFWRELCKRVCEAADLVAANSEYTRGLVLQVAPGAKVVALPLGVDHNRFCPGDKGLAKQRFAAEGKIVLSSASRLQAYKGHETVLRALAELPERQRIRMVYLIAGKGPYGDELRRLTKDLRLDEQVRFLGFVPEDDLPDFYRASDLFVLCTRETVGRQEVEGFGLVFLEAQACGTAVVGTRTGGIPDAVKEGEGGWLIAEDDSTALARILGSLADEPEPFRQAGAEARRRVERECTWGSYMHRFAAALEVEGIHIA
jgi:phosphatidyl-myo-inositol dimannoside synthase